MSGCKKKNADWFMWLITGMTLWNIVFAFLLENLWHFFAGVVHGIALVMALLFVLLKASESSDNAQEHRQSGAASGDSVGCSEARP